MEGSEIVYHMLNENYRMRQWAEATSEEVMAEGNPELIEDTKPQIKETHWTPSRRNKRNSPLMPHSKNAER